MNCDRIEPLLPPYLDGDLPPDQRQMVTGHLAACARCQALLRALRRVDAVAASWPVLPAVMEPHLERIDAAVDRRIRRLRLFLPLLFIARRTASLAAASAVILVVALLGFGAILAEGRLAPPARPLAGVPAALGALLGQLRPLPAATRLTASAGLYPDALPRVVQVTVMDYRQSSTRTEAKPSALRPALEALAHARFIRHDPALGARVRPQTYLVQLRLRDGTAIALIYLPAASGPNVEDPSRGDWWEAPGLDAAMAPLLPGPPVAGPTPAEGEDAVLADPYDWAPTAGQLDRRPRFSPDGRLLVYLPTAGTAATRVVVRDLASGTERDLTPQAGFRYTAATWSPDGRSLAVIQDQPGVGGPSWLWRIAVDSGEAHVLYRQDPCTPSARGPSLAVIRWLPDGSAIEVGGTPFDCRNQPLRAVRADGSGAGTVPQPTPVSLPGGTLPGTARVLAEADGAAFLAVPASDVNAAAGLALVRSDQTEGRLTTLGIFPAGTRLDPAALSPGRRWLALVAAGAGDGAASRLWVVRSDGSGLRAIKGEPYQLIPGGGIQLTDSGQGYFVGLPAGAGGEEGDLYAFDAAAGTAHRVAAGGPLRAVLDLTPDGRHLLILRGPLAHPALHLITVGPPGRVLVPTRTAEMGAAPTPLPPAAPLPALPAPAEALAAAPGPGTTVYALLATNALYRSDDGGQSWRRLPLPAAENPIGAGAATPGPVTVSVPAQSLAVAASDPRRIFAVAEHVLYGSADGGESWTPLNDAVYAWTMADAAGRILYVWHEPSGMGTSAAGLYRSDDGGRAWRAVYTGAFPPVLDSTHCPCSHEGISALAASPTDPNVLLAGTDFGVFRSTDGGRTWVDLQAGLPPSTRLPYRWTPFLALDASGTTYALSEVWSDPTSGRADLLRLDAGQSSWSVVGRGALDRVEDPAASFFGINAFVVDRSRAGWLYLGTNRGLLVSEDAGRSWVSASIPGVRAVYRIAAGPSGGAAPRLYLWTDAGLVTWTGGR
jgi:anti-sigma factor RsiW